LLCANPARIDWQRLSGNPGLFAPDPTRYRANTERITKLLTRMHTKT